MRIWMITGAGRGLGRAFIQEAAEFLYKMAASKSLPQIITIGQDCSDASLNHYKQIIQEIESYYDDSCRTAFED